MTKPTSPSLQAVGEIPNCTLNPLAFQNENASNGASPNDMSGFEADAFYSPTPTEPNRYRMSVGLAQSPEMKGLQTLSKVFDTCAVMVVLRVRPFSEKEKKKGEKKCIEIGDLYSISFTGERAKYSKYAFDAVLPPECTQRMTYEASCKPIFDKVMEGFNGCCFAYGQTGSGKTYTMTGVENSIGIIPRVCEDLFSYTERHPEFVLEVVMSYIEIYQEDVRDLLSSQRGQKLQVHEDLSTGGKGVYVEGCASVRVDSYTAVSKLLERGAKRRVVGETKMNEKSSRSHAVLTLHIAKKNATDLEGLTQVISKLHLVDLAGSERADAAGTSGKQLKEGAKINQSLSALGNVIYALTDKSFRGDHVPYRDSKLTRILQASAHSAHRAIHLGQTDTTQGQLFETQALLEASQHMHKPTQIKASNSQAQSRTRHRTYTCASKPAPAG
ncbi:hypothetical protein CYMTET_14482 [Cymbomonas tetramitiformis]|uniref:Kinesin-like protein n=1 Tax=Cymbomonas tetramitiformis TaxID=36881 RepID=A0AAE0L9Z4_9CHLO|nr:hypothetical protein CYMTET_14482 [Cymbomonas tetramitiformis]